MATVPAFKLKDFGDFGNRATVFGADLIDPRQSNRPSSCRDFSPATGKSPLRVHSRPMQFILPTGLCPLRSESD
jgi:hypothetical protein